MKEQVNIFKPGWYAFHIARRTDNGEMVILMFHEGKKKESDANGRKFSSMRRLPFDGRMTIALIGCEWVESEEELREKVKLHVEQWGCGLIGGDRKS